jgi:hypothetical protein
MIDAFPFESFLTPDGNVDTSITSFWPYSGDAATTESLTDASPAMWVLTVLGILVTISMLIAWVWYEHRRLTEAAERLRAQGRWSR